MANNQYVNKVQFVRNGVTVTLMDLTSDTVTADKLLAGYTAHDHSGAPITGTASGSVEEINLRELICPQQTVTPSSYTVNLDHVSGIVIGGHYVVTYDGNEYLFTAGDLWGGNGICAGEQTYYYDHSTRTDEIAPFLLWEVFNDVTRTPKLYAKDNNSHTIKVERIDRNDITTTIICPQQTVTTNSSKIGSLSNTTAQLVVGDYYLVTYDGTEWMLTAAELWGETTGVGDDQTIWNSTTDDSVYPFFAYNNGQGMGFYAIDANASHTIKIEHIDSIPDALVLTTKTITSNGTYNASSDNATGYSSVTVNVSGGGGGTGGITQDQNGYLVLSPDGGGGSGGSTTLKMGVLRPDATLVEKWTYDKLIVEEAGVTLPSYSTSAQTLISNAALDEVDVDFDSYDYMVLYRYIAVPTYSQGTGYGKGRFAYFFGSRCDELSDVPGNLLSDNGVYHTTRSGVVAPSNHFKYCYWSSASSFVAASNLSTVYGIYVTQTNANYSTLSSPTYIRPSSPALIIRPNASYLAQTYFEAITDIRFQYVVELWRAPRNNLNIDGFGVDSQLSHVISCLQSSTGTLT